MCAARTIVFEYAEAWLNDGARFSIEPALAPGPFAPRPGAIFGSLGDSAPDNWGRRLMQRRERLAAKRTDESRQAARLGDIADAGLAIFCWCNRCGHNSSVDSRMLAAKVGPALPVPEIGTRMRCTNCQSKDIATRPAWPSLGQVARPRGIVTGHPDYAPSPTPTLSSPAVWR